MRWKPTYGRILIELMWGDSTVWKTGTGTVNLTKLSRKIRVRPVRLVEYLKELKTLGYFETLSLDYKTITFKLKTPEWATVTRNTAASRWR